MLNGLHQTNESFETEWFAEYQTKYHRVWLDHRDYWTTGLLDYLYLLYPSETVALHLAVESVVEQLSTAVKHNGSRNQGSWGWILLCQASDPLGQGTSYMLLELEFGTSASSPSNCASEIAKYCIQQTTPVLSLLTCLDIELPTVIIQRLGSSCPSSFRADGH